MQCGDCEKCPFAVDGKPPHEPVPPVFPVAAQGIIVLEGPTQQDAQDGKLLAGSSGRALKGTMRETGLDQYDLAFIPAVACRSTKTPTESERRAAVKACAPLFAHHYAPMQHLPTLAAGKWAGGAVEMVRHGKLTARAVKNERGFLRDTNTLILTWAPQFALFANTWELGNFECDLRRFERMLGGRLQAPPKSLVINATAADISCLHAEAKKVGFVAIDIETGSSDPARPWTGKSPLEARLKSIGFGTPDHAVSLLWPPDADGLNAIRAVLDDTSIVKVFQNGEHFDRPVLERYDLPVAEPVEDTRTLRRSTSTTSPLALRYLGSIFTDFEAWKSDEVLENEDDK